MSLRGRMWKKVCQEREERVEGIYHGDAKKGCPELDMRLRRVELYGLWGIFVS